MQAEPRPVRLRDHYAGQRGEEEQQEHAAAAAGAGAAAAKAEALLEPVEDPVEQQELEEAGDEAPKEGGHSF